MTKNYIKLSEWKEEIIKHCTVAKEEVVILIDKYDKEDGLKQILHELFEMEDHLK